MLFGEYGKSGLENVVNLKAHKKRLRLCQSLFRWKVFSLLPDVYRMMQLLLHCRLKLVNALGMCGEL